MSGVCVCVGSREAQLERLRLRLRDWQLHVREQESSGSGSDPLCVAGGDCESRAQESTPLPCSFLSPRNGCSCCCVLFCSEARKRGRLLLLLL